MLLFLSLLAADPGLVLLVPPDPDGGSFAAAVSADGRVVVGQHNGAAGVFAFRARDGVFVDVGDLDGGLVFSSGVAVANDGVVFGTGYVGNAVEPGDVDGVQVGFSFDDAFVVLGDLSGNEAITNIAAVSGDGRVVVGGAYPVVDADFLPFVVEDGVATALPLRAGATRGEARAISDDGRVIVCADDSGSAAFSSGYLVVDRALGADLPVAPAAISGDGRVVVGFVPDGDFIQAVRVVDGGDAERLGELPGGSPSSEALSASFDGAVIVGRSATGVDEGDPDSEEAFIYTARDGIRRLEDVAVDVGIDLAGLDGGFLSQATAVSADGTVVVGNAVVGNVATRRVRAFVLTLPATSEGEGEEGEGEGEGEPDGEDLVVTPPSGCSCDAIGAPLWLGLVVVSTTRRRRR